MNRTLSFSDIRPLIVVPALISLGITVLRLVGELSRWSPTFFSREAGGAGALVGIVWLVPVFGIYFALKLGRRGHGPVSRSRAIGYAVAGVALFVVIGVAASRFQLPLLKQLLLFNGAAALSALVAYRGWPELAKMNLVYGLAARIPVAIVMFIAMSQNWGTHYELGPPGLPEMSLLAKWTMIGLLPQLVFWIGFTVVVGSLFGSLSLLAVRQQKPAVATR